MAATRVSTGGQVWWWTLVVAALVFALLGDWRYATASAQGLYLPGALWLSAITLLATAAALADRRAPPPAERHWTRNDWLAFVSLLMVAAFFRGWRFGEYPPPDLFGFEEFQTGGLAEQITQIGNWPFEFPLTNLLPALSFTLLGPSAFALRLPFLITSSLAPIFLFAALRRVVSLPAAWFAALALAVGRWPAAAARFADELFFPIALVAAVAWLFIRAVQRRRQLDAFAVALVSADFFYAYSGYRVFPPLLLVSTVGLLVWRRRTLAAFRCLLLAVSVWATLLGLGMVRTVAFGDPLLFEAIERHDQAWNESGSWGTRLSTAIERLRLGWALFTTSGDDIATVNIPNEPMLDVASATVATIAVVVGLARLRDPLRLIATLAFGLPFVACGLVPLNFNASRYFVLLVPLYFLIGLLIDDLRRWIRLPAAATAALAAIILGLNFLGLQRLIDNPEVRLWFINPENTVVAALHRLPPGAVVRQLTYDCTNALEPSHYRWFTRHVSGGRAASLRDALVVLPNETGPLYWVTQLRPETRAVAELVQLVCPTAQSEVWFTEKDFAEMSVVRVDDPHACGELPAGGLHASYVTVDAQGARQESSRVEPMVTAYSVPWGPTLRYLNREVQSLSAEWQGSLLPPRAGQYRLRLEVAGASGTLSVGGQQQDVVARGDDWQSATLAVSVPEGSKAIAVTAKISALPDLRPRARLYWTAPDADEELIEPQYLRPGAGDPQLG